MPWRALYADGSVLEQHPGVSTEHIDRARLTRFELRADNGRDLIAVEFTPGGGRNLVYRRRTAMRMDASVPVVTHLVGWRDRDSGRVIVHPVTEDGRIGGPTEDHGIDLVPAELA